MNNHTSDDGDDEEDEVSVPPSQKTLRIHLNPEEVAHRGKKRRAPPQQDPLDRANDLLNNLAFPSSSIDEPPLVDYEFCRFSDDQWLDELSPDECKTDFCFMCECIQASDQYHYNIHYQKLLDIIEKHFGTTDMQYLCKLLQTCYNENFRKPNSLPYWTLRSIFDHLNAHNPTPFGEQLLTLKYLNKIKRVLIDGNIVMKHPETGHLKIHHENTNLLLKIIERISALTNQIKRVKT